MAVRNFEVDCHGKSYGGKDPEQQLIQVASGTTLYLGPTLADHPMVHTVHFKVVAAIVTRLPICGQVGRWRIYLGCQLVNPTSQRIQAYKVRALHPCPMAVHPSARNGSKTDLSG